MGHVQTRVRNGKKRYVVRYTDANGKERTKTFDKLGRHDLPDTAKHYLNKIEATLRDSTYVDPELSKIGLRSYADKWKDRARAKNTKRLRHQFVANLGELGDRPIGQIQPSEVRDWLDLLAGQRPWTKRKGLGDRTRQMYLQSLRALLNIAVDDGLISKNPCRKIQVTKHSLTTVGKNQLLTAEQIHSIMDAVRVEPFKTMILVSASTGLRPGEVAGLRVMDVDFLRREIHVNQQADIDARTPPTEMLKTDESRRTIPAPQGTLDAIAAYLATVERTRESELFRSRRGGRWTSIYIAHQFDVMCERAGVEGFTFHDLRHFYASALIQAGLSVKTVQTRLGHSTPDVTLRVYVHLWPGQEDKTRDAIDVALTRDGTERRDQDGTKATNE